MSISLESITKGKQKLPPRIIIYGVDGIGKSSFAADAPDAIFTQTENRLSHLDVAKFPLARTWDDAMKTLEVLFEQDHKYKYHVTDSLDWLEKLAHKELCKRHGEESIVSNTKGSPFSFGRGWGLADELMAEYLEALEALQTELGMGIIIIAHAKIKKFDDPMRESYDKYNLAVHEKVSERYKQWADCVFFANYKVMTKGEEVGYKKVKHKAKGVGERILYTEERPAYEAKNSYDLPEEMPLLYENPFSEFERHYKAFLKDKK